MERFRRVLLNIIEVIKKPEMRVLPGQLAFFFVISLIPLIAVLGTIMSSFSLPIDTLEDALKQVLPSGVADTFLTLLDGTGINFNIIIFLISAFFLASNGTHSIIITSNEIYKIESKNIIKRRLKAIMMIVILVFLIIFLLVVPVFGDSIFGVLKLIFHDSSTLEFIYSIYKVLKYPLSMLMIYYNIKLIYIIAPDKKIESHSTRNGAIFTTISWIIATEFYSFYVLRFTNYDRFYGSLSSLLILLLWVYLLSYIFVLGLAFNAGNTLEIKKSKKRLEKDKKKINV